MFEGSVSFQIRLKAKDAQLRPKLNNVTGTYLQT